MRPAARVQAAIELLDEIIAAANQNGPAADTLIANWFRARRYAGSKDRRAITELVYRAIRAFGDVPVGGRAALLAFSDVHVHFDGSPYGPAIIAPDEVGASPIDVPQWLVTKIPVEEHKPLLERAPLDLRVNRLKTTREAMLAQLPGATEIPGVPYGLRLDQAAQISDLGGLVEVQDAGSQLIAVACAVKPGMTVVDLCAGAGGKTLALAAEMAGQGRLIACDTGKRRLHRLPQRAEKAGAEGIELYLLNPSQEAIGLAALNNEADVVLIDAPCSGSGTWRRNPELRWRLTPSRLAQVVELQSHLLGIGAALVKPGGALVYAVCSLLPEEGEKQIAQFLARHPHFAQADAGLALGSPMGDGVLMTPSRDGTDGFFVARLARSC